MIKAIAAMSENRVIGLKNKIPWYLPYDLKRFKQLTLNQTVIMGRKTWDSLPIKPLPNRTNIVLTSQQIKGVICIDSLDELLQTYSDFWVIGGSTVYKSCMPFVQQIYLTVLKQSLEGDAFFPVFEDSFRTTKVEDFEEYQFKVYERI